jgi:putative FmdB family regulatory protein
VPRYQYRCTACDEISVIYHSSSETQSVCPVCDSDSTLVKMLTTFTTKKAGTKSNKTGQITEQFIEDSRQELEQQKDKLNKDR